MLQKYFWLWVLQKFENICVWCNVSFSQWWLIYIMKYVWNYQKAIIIQTEYAVWTKSYMALKETSHEWNIKLKDFLHNKHFKPLKSDRCVFISIKSKYFLCVVIHVDCDTKYHENTKEMDELMKKLCAEILKFWEGNCFCAKEKSIQQLRKLIIFFQCFLSS